MIKFLVLFTCVVFVVCGENKKEEFAASPELVTKILDALSACVKNENLQEIVAFLIDGGYKPDPEFKKLINCVFDKTGFIKENGRLNVNKAADLFPDKEKMKKLLTECDKDYGSPEDNSYETLVCYQKISPFKILFPKST